MEGRGRVPACAEVMKSMTDAMLIMTVGMLGAPHGSVGTSPWLVTAQVLREEDMIPTCTLRPPLVTTIGPRGDCKKKEE